MRTILLYWPYLLGLVPLLGAYACILRHAWRNRN